MPANPVLVKSFSEVGSPIWIVKHWISGIQRLPHANVMHYKMRREGSSRRVTVVLRRRDYVGGHNDANAGITETTRGRVISVHAQEPII